MNNILLDKIKEFCQLNDISDVDCFIDELIEIGLSVKKYGNSPFIGQTTPQKSDINSQPIRESTPTSNKPKIRIINK